MGIGNYLGTKAEIEFEQMERRREEYLVLEWYIEFL